MNTNDWQNGYTAGYQNGWEAGYNRGKTEGLPPSNPYKPNLQDDYLNKKPSFGHTCFVCGRFFEAGKAYGYVCGYHNCPSKTYCSTTSSVTAVASSNACINSSNTAVFDPWYSVNASSAVPDGLSYEEIYGSVVYQQNKKKE
jgi:hypothetical protein